MNPDSQIPNFTAYLKGKGHTKKSIQSRLSVFHQYCQWLEKEQLAIDEISYQDVLEYMRKCKIRGVKQRTIQHYIGTLKNYYDYAVQAGKIINNPTATVEIKGVQRKQLHLVLEVHTLHKLYHQYPIETPEQQRNKVMIGLMVYQGLKVQELGKLEVKDIKLREGKIEVPGSKKSNGRTLRLEAVQIMDVYQYIMEVRQLLLESDQETELLFIIKQGNQQSISGMMKPIMRQLKKIVPSVENANHIRASVITHWLKKYNLREVQYRAGHRFISSTESYQQNDTESLQRDIDQYHPLG
jgi:site-specific recombinase XerD